MTDFRYLCLLALIIVLPGGGLLCLAIHGVNKLIRRGR